MLVRRRPLLRAAVVGGGAYVAGKKAAQRSAQQAEQDAEQQERLTKLERERQQAPAPGDGGRASATGAGPSTADQLAQLSALHEHGALTDGEFAAAKARLLGA